MSRIFKCEKCQQEFEDIFYVLFTDCNGSKLQMLCKPCAKIVKETTTNRVVKVFDNSELRRSFE